jgi:hypothetical protein
MEIAGRILAGVFGTAGLLLKLAGGLITIFVIFFVAKSLITGESLTDHRDSVVDLNNRVMALDERLVSKDPDAVTATDVDDFDRQYRTLLAEAEDKRPSDLKGDLAKLWDGDTELLRSRVEFLRLFRAVVLGGDSSQAAALEANARAVDRLAVELNAVVDRLNDSG